MAEKKGINWWMMIVIAAAATGVYFLGRSGVLENVKRSEGTDKQVTHTKETITLQPLIIKVTDSSYDKNGKGTPVILYVNGQPRVVPEIKIDTAAILAEFYRTAFYDTTIPITRGSIRLQEQVSRNRITNQAIELNTTDTTITRTIVKTLPKSFIGYLDFNAFGGRNFGAAYTGLSFKMPDDKIFGAGIGYHHEFLPPPGEKRSRGLFFGVRTSMPLKLKKRIPDVTIFNPTISEKSDTIIRRSNEKF